MLPRVLRAFLLLAFLPACNDVGRTWPGGIGAVLRFRDTDHVLIV